VLALAGELDLAGASRLSEAFAALSDTPYERIVVDLGELTFIDSTGIHTLLEAEQAIRARGGLMTLRAPTSDVQRIFEIIHLAELLPIEYEASPGIRSRSVGRSD
jgi:anti-anti-sigma factor